VTLCSNQPARQFGVVLTGILPSKVTKSKESQEPDPHRLKFNRIEQPVTLFEVGGMVLKPKNPTLAKEARVGHPEVFGGRFLSREVQVSSRTK
jgi:hypothetical protein